MFIIFGMIVFLLFKTKIFAIIILGAYISIFYKSKGLVDSLILILLCLILSLSHSYLPEKEVYKGKVDKIHSYGFTLKGFAYRIYVSGDYKVGLDDKVSLTGFLEKEATPSFNRHIGKISNADILEHKERQSIRKTIYKQFPEQFEMLFSSSNDHIINSLGLQMMGIFAIYKLLYTRFLGELRYEKTFLLSLSFLFGRSFVWYRLLFKSFKISNNHQIVLLLIMFPNALFSPSFIYAYSLFLLSRLSNAFKHLNPSLLFAQLSLFFFNEWHASMLFIYPVLKYLSGCYALLILSACFIPPLNLLLSKTQTFGSLVLASSIYQRFLLRGTFHFMSFFILGFTKTTKDHVLMFLMMIIVLQHPPLARLTYIDVGQGDSTLVSLPFNVSHYLIDTGRKHAYRDVKKVLKKHGVKNLDYLVLTHDDADHVENKDVLLKEFYPKIVMEEKSQNIDLMQSQLQAHDFGDGNEDSIILSFKMHGLTYLFLGDAHKKQEEMLVKLDPNFKVDVLKLGHHGSDTSTSDQLLKIGKPSIGIISSKPSVYNHPRPEVMRRLLNHNVLAIQTSHEGDITFYSTPFMKWIKTSQGSFAIIDKGD